MITIGNVFVYPQDEHISAVLSGHETILPEDVKKTIRESATHHATDILNKLRELQVDIVGHYFGDGELLGIAREQMYWMWGSDPIPRYLSAAEVSFTGIT